MGIRFTVTRTFAVGELGTLAFIADEPIALAFGTQHRVRVTGPEGETVEAVASVEAVRREASGEEFTALLFATLGVRDIEAGASVLILGDMGDPGPG